MSEIKHTPGPWRRSTTAKLCILSSSKNHSKTICVMKNPHNPDWEANAALIAAAPDMLEVLQGLLKAVEGHEKRTGVTQFHPSIDKARTAITKATK